LQSTAIAQPYGLDSRATLAPFLNGAMPSGIPVTAGDWTAVNAFPNVSFQDPTWVTSLPGTNKLIVASREGYVWSVVNDPTITTKSLFLDLSAHTQGWNDSGLLGLAFHPQFGQAGSPNRGYLYIYYSYTPGPVVGSASAPPYNRTTPTYNRLSRFTVPDGSTTADPASEVVLINQYKTDLWHNGGSMFFGADGYLYFTNGDGGGSNDEYHLSQRLDQGLYAGVFRIDVDKNSATSHPIRRQPLGSATPRAGTPDTYSANYYIPNDNPWQDTTGGTLEEYWAVGLRSPHRMTRDPVTGQVWLGDVGQDTWEEVDLVQKAANFQWPYREGANPGFRPMPSPLLGTDTPPIYNYNHSSGSTCVIGGYVYRGSQFSAQLGGKYIFGDNTSNQIWSMVLNGSDTPTVTPLVKLPPGSNYTGGLSTFGLDSNNELYMATTGPTGSIYKLQLANQSFLKAIPTLLSQTGVFSNLATLTPTPGIVPYTVNSGFWSDGAGKQRWIAVPTGSKIGFSVQGDWTFPAGTVFIKHFELGTDDRDSTVRKRLETRLIVRATNGGVYGVTYKWRADNSDADLLVGSLSEPITITTTTGTRIQNWYYPSQQDCLTCHNANANYVLGVKTRQLNGQLTYPGGVTDNQLRTLNHLSLLSPAQNEADIPTFGALVNVSDTTQPLETRVRSYLDSNCAQCHRPSGAPSYWDARFDTPISQQGIIDGPLANTLGVTNAKVLASASVARSMMNLRMSISGNRNQMPPLARNTVDRAAVATLTAYINSLTPPPLPYAGPDQGVAVGATVTLAGSVSQIAANAPVTYQWNQVIGQQVALSAPTSATTRFVAPAAGSFAFALTVTAGGVQGTSDPVVISVGPSTAPIPSSLPSNLTLAAGETGTLTIAPVGIPAPTIQWLKNGQPIPGATQRVLQLGGVQLSDAGSYAALLTNSQGSATSNTTVVTINAPVAIQTQPQSPSSPVALNSAVTFAVGAAGTGPIAYQWYRNGVPIPGAVTSSYTVNSAQATDAGLYSVVVSNGVGSTNSSAVTLSFPGLTRLVNISARAVAAPGSQVLTAGFVLGGSGTKALLLRGVGPSLAGFGVPGFLPTAQIQLFDVNGASLGSNGQWDGGSNASAIAETAQAVGAFPLTAQSADGSLLSTLNPGNYSAQVTGSNNATGVALAEVYDAGLGGAASILNFSVRGQAGTGAAVLTAGFVVSGSQPVQVLVRGIGPALGSFGVTGVLADPLLQVYDGKSNFIAQNDNWGDAGAAQISSAFTAAGAFALPTGSADSALLLTLSPGSYSATVSGVGGTTGVALIEIYLLQ
jgi:uncharacterized repeat protein (TIGR03806 family)